MKMTNDTGPGCGSGDTERAMRIEGCCSELSGDMPTWMVYAMLTGCTAASLFFVAGLLGLFTQALAQAMGQ